MLWRRHHLRLLLNSILWLRHCRLHTQTTQWRDIVGIRIINVETWCCRFHVEISKHHLCIFNQGIIWIGYLRWTSQGVIISILRLLLQLKADLWRRSYRRIRVALNISEVLFLLMILVCPRVVNLVGQSDLMLHIHLLLAFEFHTRLPLLHRRLHIVHIWLVVFLDADSTWIERELLLLLQRIIVIVAHHSF